MTSSRLTLSDLERLNSRSLRFPALLSYNGAELGHMLLLNINRKAYMGSPETLLHLTLKDQSQGHSDFEALYLSYTICYCETGLQKIATCHTNCRCQAERQGSWTSCYKHIT